MSVNGTATLKWSLDSGFELDLEAQGDGVHVRLIDLPVRVDGLETLMAEPHRLHHLDVLFKAHVDWDGAPGQLHDALVSLDDERLELRAKVEDAETGAERSFAVSVPVSLSRDAPPSGGVVLPAPEEDELDWDDETTVERMFGDMPLPSPTQEDPLSQSGGHKVSGLDALLQALSAPECDDATGEVPLGAARAIAKMAAKTVRDVARPVKEAVKSMVEGPPPSYSLEREALSFLQILLDREQLELEDAARLGELLSGVGAILASRRSPEDKAGALSNWLLDQDAVEELYVGDEELADFLEQW